MYTKVDYVRRMFIVQALTFMLTWSALAGATCSGLEDEPGRPEVFNAAALLRTDALDAQILRRANVEVDDLARSPHSTVSILSLLDATTNRHGSLPIYAWTELALLMHGRPTRTNRGLKKILFSRTASLLTLRVPVSRLANLPIAALRLGPQHYTLEMLGTRSYNTLRPSLESIYSLVSFRKKTMVTAGRATRVPTSYNEINLPGAWANRGIVHARLVAEYAGGEQEILMSKERLEPVRELNGTFSFDGDFLLVRLLVTGDQLNLLIGRENF